MRTLQSIALVSLLLLALPGAYAQQDAEKSTGYVFTDQIRLKTTPVKNQYRSGTCWSYGGLSFLESELLNSGKGTYDFSEAFVIRNVYARKAEQYVRWQGNINFGGGGAFHDVMEVLTHDGMVPEQVYSGLTTDDEHFVHGEMDNNFAAYVKAVTENKNGRLSPVWKQGFDGLLDAYLGVVPENFIYDGRSYTPKTFAESLGFNPDDYLELGSYTHHPFYEKFILEIPDNWMLHAMYNVPLDEMMEIIDRSLAQGHTVAWGADISEKGFSWSNGLAVVPDEDKTDLSGTEKEKWEKLTPTERKKMLYSFDEPVKEKTITQQMRQKAFDNYSTTDDHAMEIVGNATDQNGNKYYIVKNSWGADGHIYNGYLYASESFVRYKTVDVMVHKNVIPQPIRQKMGI
ncbi:MAG: C1 family peptidase [Bacteroidales bacterium]|jgi:bleomycin hydrolase|nr:C1 family peptidase [Bacteroidales bacterium]NCU36998.1 aminopeptidase [Candidatus Falkowbacteria bacterium]MDD2632837.1 C1 family peptidase [Bacteroidales bacterium]MDD3526183.1 C1 family peptidase [Bacteroidales bacterium]MDD4175637.1 C1 family peptidase [Bacteroidales bacterium]